jgi:hypothetical protein
MFVPFLKRLLEPILLLRVTTPGYNGKLSRDKMSCDKMSRDKMSRDKMSLLEM